MRAVIISRAGSVLLRDKDSGLDVIAMTPAQASWLSSFMQLHTTSEIVVQLRLAAHHAENNRQQPFEEKEFLPRI